MDECKVCLVTGSSRGLGKGIAEKFAQNGYKVILNTLKNNKSEAEQLIEHLKKQGYEVTAIYADVSNEAEVKEMFDQVKRMYNQLDVLVNNAGIGSDCKIENLTMEEWERAINVNLNGVFLCCREAVELLVNKTSSIINISSTAALKGNVFLGSTLYSTTKIGVIGFTKALSQEMQGQCRVNCVAPGIIRDTSAFARKYFEDERSKYALEAIPMRRFGQVKEVASVVYFLASPMSSYINGQCIHINGGWIMP